MDDAKEADIIQMVVFGQLVVCESMPPWISMARTYFLQIISPLFEKTKLAVYILYEYLSNLSPNPGIS